jgi:hypothetical protein
MLPVLQYLENEGILSTLNGVGAITIRFADADVALSHSTADGDGSQTKGPTSLA